MDGFSGKVVLVTGGTQGIGLAAAEAFRAAGATVHVTGTRAAAGDYDWPLDGFVYHRLLVDDDAQRAALSEAIPALDILVNNVGGGHPDEYETNVFAMIINKNLVSVMDLCTRFRARLAERGGAIVNVGSVTCFTSQKERPAYSAGKAGLLGLTKALADQWVHDGIRVNLVAPGFVRTRLSQRMRDNPDHEKRLIAAVPMKRWADPEEVAGPILFLASPAASYVTGASLVVDGGLLIR